MHIRTVGINVHIINEITALKTVSFSAFVAFCGPPIQSKLSTPEGLLFIFTANIFAKITATSNSLALFNMPV